MRIGAIDESVTSTEPGSLPLRIEQRSSSVRAATTLLLSSALVCACVLPFGLVAAAAADSPETLAMMLDRPLISLKLGAGLLAGMLLVAWPVRVGLARLGRSAIVTVEAGTVVKRETSWFGNVAWSEPLAAYRGIAHHIRASLSGARHEIVLVHPDPRRTVLLHFADRVQQSELERFAQMLGQPIVQAREIYAVGVRATPQPIAA